MLLHRVVPSVTSIVALAVGVRMVDSWSCDGSGAVTRCCDVLFCCCVVSCCVVLCTLVECENVCVHCKDADVNVYVYVCVCG